jgi:hypothetical protein
MFREIDVDPSFFTLLQPKIPTDDARSSRCDQPLMPQSITPNFPSKFNSAFVRDNVQKNRCWATIFHTIIAGDADKWCEKQPM